MFIRNINKQKNIKLYQTDAEDIKNYLIQHDIFPISFENSNWIFIDCKELKNIIKELNIK